ncbi:hypothetical protein HMPREF9551_04567 [Escherichia coli MS 196-1]|nr:hypothetical protein HMPREF9551_04567 [Escherichia coli MS 196-1]EYE09332.1 hypothetical protein AC80_5478 [Escherichia coli 1-110-08_S4_C1]
MSVVRELVAPVFSRASCSLVVFPTETLSGLNSAAPFLSELVFSLMDCE